MSIETGIGFSNEKNTLSAVNYAASQARKNLNGAEVDLVFVFATIHYDFTKISAVIEKVLGCSTIVGCSTAGIILSESVETYGIGVLAIGSDDLKCSINHVKQEMMASPFEAGLFLARSSSADIAKENKYGFLFFIDGGIQDMSIFLKGLQNVLGSIFPMVGGGSCDDFHFRESYQICRNQVFSNGAVGVMFGGNISLGVGAEHGWKPLGKPRVTSATSGNIIQTINDEPAIQIFHDYLGEETNKLESEQLQNIAILYPIGVLIDGSDEYLLRNAIRITPEGYIVCQGDVPENAEIHIMIGNKSSCLQAVRMSAIKARDQLQGKQAKFVFVINCMTRLKLFGRTAHHEIRIVKEIFGEDIPVFGMYSNGEVYPFKTTEKFKQPYHQNESVVILAFA